MTLYRTIRDYKTETYAETENAFLTALMDDLYIARRSFDNQNGNLYAITRQRTQGSQNVYTPSHIDDMAGPSMTAPLWQISSDKDEESQLSPTIPRQMHSTMPPKPFPLDVGRTGPTMFALDESDILSHNISCRTQDNYSTPRMLDIIRSTSDSICDDLV